MSVRKRIEKLEHVDVNALIEKGAKVKEDRAEESKKWTSVNLRIAVEMIKDVDYAVKNRVGITRTGWILEAIHEKLKKELKDE